MNEAVATDQKHELRLRVFTVQRPQRVYRIRDARAFEFEIRDDKGLIVCRREARHGKAMYAVGQIGRLLVRRCGGGHPQHAVEIGFLARSLSEGEVAEVGRVEAPAEESDAPGERGLHPSARPAR